MTNYYDNEKNARDYIEMAEGYDGRELIKVLKQYLPDGASLLELGMGPGVDLELLNQSYQVTVREFQNISVTGDLILEIVTSAENPRPDQTPLLNYIEIIRQDQ